MNKIYEAYKEVPVEIEGVEYKILPLTPKVLFDLQNFVNKKRAKMIDLIFEGDRDAIMEEKRKLISKPFNIQDIQESDSDAMFYMGYLRCSVRDKYSFDAFLDLENGTAAQKVIEIVTGITGDEKNVETVQET